VGGHRETFESSRAVIATFADKINHLGPAGSGHLVKAINNALLAANMLSASEGLAAIARHGVDVPSALEAINGSSGRSWVTMQRFPENILTGDAYGFALGMHCKDMENALRAIREPHADGTNVAAPMLELARCLMNSAREQYGADVDHTETSRLAARSNRIDFGSLPNRGRGAA
jgi:3-hydroxyisobutyrate dehydrogenase